MDIRYLEYLGICWKIFGFQYTDTIKFRIPMWFTFDYYCEHGEPLA